MGSKEGRDAGANLMLLLMTKAVTMQTARPQLAPGRVTASTQMSQWEGNPGLLIGNRESSAFLQMPSGLPRDGSQALLASLALNARAIREPSVTLL